MSSSSLLTVFTPTFNRCRELGRLYESLCAQTDMRFEWLVVDDGSVDGTEKLVARWADEAPFPVRYIRQANRGKHVAHNRGAKEAAAQLFMCVDSDDWLEPFAVETIIRDSAALDTEESLLYPRLFASQAALDTWFPEEVDKIELSDMRMKYRLIVETAIVFNTEVLRRHPFPVVEGERYMPEGSAYYDFREPELFLVRNTGFYRCEYLDEGLTRNIWSNWLRNPVGTALSLLKRYSAACRYTGFHGLRERFAVLTGLESLNMALGKNAFSDCPNDGALAIAAFPVAVYLRRKRFGKVLS